MLRRSSLPLACSPQISLLWLQGIVNLIVGGKHNLMNPRRQKLGRLTGRSHDLLSNAAVCSGVGNSLDMHKLNWILLPALTLHSPPQLREITVFCLFVTCWVLGRYSAPSWRAFSWSLGGRLGKWERCCCSFCRQPETNKPRKSIGS